MKTSFAYELTVIDFFMYWAGVTFRGRFPKLTLILIIAIAVVGTLLYFVSDSDRGSKFILGASVLFILLLICLPVIIVVPSLIFVFISGYTIGLQTLSFIKGKVHIEGRGVKRQFEVDDIDKVVAMGRICIIFYAESKSAFVPSYIFKQFQIQTDQ